MSEKKRMSAKDWIKAEAMYESGDYSLEQIAEQFGVHKITVQRHMKSKGIEKGAAAKRIKEKVEKRLEEAAEAEIDVTTQRIQEVKERHYTLNTTIDKKITREIIEAEKDGRPISTAHANIKTLKLAAETLRITRGNEYDILGVTDEPGDDDLPTLEVREMLEDEIAEIRDGQAKQAEDMGIVLTDESEGVSDEEEFEDE
ncbi:hypothetical protein N7I40_004108 [Vibrio parahaemolyticus]|nr:MULTISPECIES: hypothetical protein [Vibrio harveyi group]EJL8716159.1 hypothetical protein [Vibrio alginolyticus]EJV5946481.1 hypothetical protein [Vibrio parahaemolyticus]EKN4564983.1 hypothetical protein [Vibrio parahaemolyticus]ELA7322648.1 hypothetical protein [Vibrio parahaemolyticus]ELJ1804499.1 hypothetical protein [Vibrio parahaemolyticus]